MQEIRKCGYKRAEASKTRSRCDDECIICLQPLSHNQSSTSSLFTCAWCRKSVHQNCQERWSREQRSKGRTVRCVLCRKPTEGGRSSQCIAVINGAAAAQTAATPEAPSLAFVDYEMIDHELEMLRNVFRHRIHVVLTEALYRKSILWERRLIIELIGQKQVGHGSMQLGVADTLNPDTLEGGAEERVSEEDKPAPPPPPYIDALQGKRTKCIGAFEELRSRETELQASVQGGNFSPSILRELATTKELLVAAEQRLCEAEAVLSAAVPPPSPPSPPAPLPPPTPPSPAPSASSPVTRPASPPSLSSDSALGLPTAPLVNTKLFQTVSYFDKTFNVVNCERIRWQDGSFGPFYSRWRRQCSQDGQLSSLFRLHVLLSTGVVRITTNNTNKDVSREVLAQLSKFVSLNECIHSYASEMERLEPLLNARRNSEAREDERRDREAIADEEERRARLNGLYI